MSKKIYEDKWIHFFSSMTNEELWGAKGARVFAGDESFDVNGASHSVLNGEAWIPAAGELIAHLSPRAGSVARRSWDTAAAQHAQHLIGERHSVQLHCCRAAPGRPARHARPQTTILGGRCKLTTARSAR